MRLFGFSALSSLPTLQCPPPSSLFADVSLHPHRRQLPTAVPSFPAFAHTTRRARTCLRARPRGVARVGSGLIDPPSWVVVRPTIPFPTHTVMSDQTHLPQFPSRTGRPSIPRDLLFPLWAAAFSDAEPSADVARVAPPPARTYPPSPAVARLARRVVGGCALAGCRRIDAPIVADGNTICTGSMRPPSPVLCVGSMCDENNAKHEMLWREAHRHDRLSCPLHPVVKDRGLCAHDVCVPPRRHSRCGGGGQPLCGNVCGFTVSPHERSPCVRMSMLILPAAAARGVLPRRLLPRVAARQARGCMDANTEVILNHLQDKVRHLEVKRGRIHREGAESGMSQEELKQLDADTRSQLQKARQHITNVRLYGVSEHGLEAVARDEQGIPQMNDPYMSRELAEEVGVRDVREDAAIYETALDTLKERGMDVKGLFTTVGMYLPHANHQLKGLPPSPRPLKKGRQRGWHIAFADVGLPSGWPDSSSAVPKHSIASATCGIRSIW